jgi:shikimate kinase
MVAVLLCAQLFAAVLSKEPEMNVLTVEQAATAGSVPALPNLCHRRLVLTGFMGAGKTTSGRLLASRLGWEFLDLDALIEARAGLAVPAIFAAHGEPHFRRLESQALAAALGRNHIVLALGGGAPEVLTNRLLLEQTPGTATVFLDAPFAVLFDRCMMQALNPSAQPAAAPAAQPTSQPAGDLLGQARPVFADPAAAEARYLTRQPIYRRLARHTIDTAELNTEQTVAAILVRLAQEPPAIRA